MIKLHQFARALGVPNPSPFCMKVEVWLRLAGLPYEVVASTPLGTPKRKLPYIRDDGTTVCDSHDIIAYLETKYGVNLDAELTAEQKAVSLAFDRLFAEHLYWPLLYSRWIEDSGWAQIRPIFFDPLPPVVRTLLANFVRKQTRDSLHGHGMGRHQPAEIYARAGQDLRALSAQLGDKPFFIGAQATNLDATGFAFLANIWDARIKDSPLKPLMAAHANLVAYCERMRQRCFPDGYPGA